MKITNIETIYVKAPLPYATGPATWYYTNRDALLIKISTDEGLVGWGETAALAGVRYIIERQIAPALIGADPRDHRVLWRKMWGMNFGDGMAVGGVDIALHDLWGKALGVPIYALYGGKLRDSVPAYASSLTYRSDLDPNEQYPEEAAQLVERGFRAIKLRIGGQPLRRDIEMARRVREAVGPDILLTADGNGAYSLATAIPMGKALEELGYYWFEEPLPQPGHAGYAEMTRTLDIAIAGGEGLGSRLAFKDLLDRGAVDIIQPDPALCGGIRECLFIAELAKLYGLQTMPHCWAGAIVHASVLQVLALLPDASWSRAAEPPLLEMDVVPNPFREEMVTQPFRLVDGQVAIPTGPGLGIEVDEAVVNRYRE
ncbi:MAG: mandelate racemase/muconate lactonizing enzyme family protein [Anaerolineae bacterium]|nr:mandelate racemase/muconate lactonizing enzyme family protein [Anaerolineae bacterium]